MRTAGGADGNLGVEDVFAGLFINRDRSIEGADIPHCC